MPCKGQDVSHVTAPHLVRIQCHSSNRLSWLNAFQETRRNNQVAWFNQTPISHCQVNQQNQYYATYVPANYVFVATLFVWVPVSIFMLWWHCCAYGLVELSHNNRLVRIRNTYMCALKCVFWSTQTRQEMSWGCMNSTRFCRHKQMEISWVLV